MTIGQDLMKKYPISVTERIAKEIDDAIRQAIEEDHRASHWSWWVIFWSGAFAGFILTKFLV